MTELQHTPGPWIANGNQIEAKSRLFTIIATTTSKDRSGVHYAARTNSEARANALLIAASPILLEQLQIACRALQSIGIEHQIKNIPELFGIRAAIELATAA